MATAEPGSVVFTETTEASPSRVVNTRLFYIFFFSSRLSVNGDPPRLRNICMAPRDVSGIDADSPAPTTLAAPSSARTHLIGPAFHPIHHASRHRVRRYLPKRPDVLDHGARFFFFT